MCKTMGTSNLLPNVRVIHAATYLRHTPDYHHLRLRQHMPRALGDDFPKSTHAGRKVSSTGIMNANII